MILTAIKTTRHFTAGDTVEAVRLEKKFNDLMYYDCMIDGKVVMYHVSNFKEKEE